ncbi:aminopeptidase [Fusobacterium perfoetens]|uniref:aminopeptidase n=1 Tax=Fusobacterium perfoetens TaxID=852 RepID=UPI0015A4E2F4|nr:aminopeptidase [Fusobacterium perfoetens]MCF2624677.1 aminopeptidase [Fusobacterium perfoetens]
MNNKTLQKYADLALKIGINLQQKQTLVIMSPVETAPFTRMLVETAYKMGAKEVVVHWNDDFCKKMRFLHGDIEIFENMPQWEIDSLMFYAEKNAAFLSIAANDPELLKGIDSKKIAKAQTARNVGLKSYYEKVMTNTIQWNIISVPTSAWAKKVFPNLSEEEAVENLWKAIISSVKADTENPVETWHKHLANLKEKMDYLNKKQFKKFVIKNSIGTNLTVQLPNRHLWASGKDITKSGIEFVANIPTEEVFSMPYKYGVDGIVKASKPLNYGGTLIENFSLTFKDGKIIDFSAESGEEALKNLINTDEGAKYLGEIALVPYDSPISNSNILFYNTLFDENASCHLAIGQAYPSCIEEGDTFNKQQMEEAGMNDSLVHVDFMFGTKDLDITGIDSYGREEKIFKNGNWAF